MPRYYCDYCDTYLTHDSPSVRKQHNAGYKHKANVRTYYQQFEEQQTQSLIDQRIKEHLGNAGAFPHQVGATFNQHLMSLQSNPQRPRLPVMPPPLLHPGGQPPLNQGLLPGVRPPVLPRPLIPGYGAPPTIPLPNMPPGALPRPPTLSPPVTGGVPTATSSSVIPGSFDAFNSAAASGFQRPPTSVPGAPGAATTSQDGYTYGQASETSH
ncbi:U1 small nuclear ribonucleoprotein C-2-like [Dioscorea cayenensis subsp. rotundata]|uniref:U1 small nuclear ribonucleoprotein C n=1 Tax=Dioscorea cayennensis subsp. rotundata TaxID=55577 RepID=A0AB40C2Q0_DIOCR|nr:U1 small nuclear ribonucleoprotein C-2-like [Dioscorea cayenensis subsp. rotundata]XP_039132708.1 U1 small nuclear ribonucleoprotein C-2-like [Dioscorea cayenensis subsp. rotundata]